MSSRLIRGVLTLTLAAMLASVVASSASAQGPLYAAGAPTKGALYGDGNWDRYLLGGTWLYRADPADAGIGQRFWRNLAATDGWSTAAVPNAYNAGDLSTGSMNGSVGWYRKDFTLPANAFASYIGKQDRHWILRFESVNYRATVWLNGRQIGSHAGAYLPFELDITGLRQGVNRLIIRFDDRRNAGDLPPGPSGGWWNYGGILREVYLRAVPRADLAQVAVTPQLPCSTCPATIQERVVVRNVTAKTQIVRLRGRYGRTRVEFGTHVLAPRGSWTAQAEVLIGSPHLWSPDRPSLYRASLTLSDGGGRKLSGYTTQSGIRSIAVTADGRLTLNGRLLNLRGVNLHEQDLRLGAALDPAHLRRLVGWVRSVGATLIRAHYPLNPLIQELADRYGLLIFSEVPVYQVSNQYLGQPSWRRHALSLIQANIVTNQNHPSVLLWSIGNELPTPPPAGEAGYISAAAALIHKLDPTRPATMAISNWPGVSCQPAYAPLDVLGFNEYFGWFDAGGGTTDDRDALGPWLDGLHACYPTKPLMVTEFGFDGNRQGPVEERGTYEFQSNSTAFHLDVFASKPWLSGAIYFALQDFAARPGWGGGNPWPNPPFVQKGMFDVFGQTKPTFPVLGDHYRATAQIMPPPPSAGQRRPGKHSSPAL